jgi:predicted transcriptional regulator
MSKLVTVRLDEDVATALEREARRTRRPRSVIIREALVARFAAERGDALSALSKYAGTMRGPKDLSSNKRHLAGFGAKR